MSTEQRTPRVIAAYVDAALERNRAFAAPGAHHGAVVFPELRLFVITCLDPRVDPAHFLGLGLSDAMVVRNVGGRVTPEVINDVAFVGELAENVLPDGPVFEVAVIHHTQVPPARSPTTPSASAPHPRSPRASPSPGTSTTWSPAWCRRLSPPVAEEIEPFHNRKMTERRPRNLSVAGLRTTRIYSWLKGWLPPRSSDTDAVVTTIIGTRQRSRRPARGRRSRRSGVAESTRP